MKKIENIKMRYVPSEQKFFQGKDSELQKLLNQGWNIVPEQGGNGSYNLYKPVKVFMHFTTESGGHSFEVKEMVKDYYGLTRISEKTCDRFERDFQAGKASVMYDEITDVMEIR